MLGSSNRAERTEGVLGLTSSRDGWTSEDEKEIRHGSWQRVGSGSGPAIDPLPEPLSSWGPVPSRRADRDRDHHDPVGTDAAVLRAAKVDRTPTRRVYGFRMAAGRYGSTAAISPRSPGRRSKCAIERRASLRALVSLTRGSRHGNSRHPRRRLVGRRARRSPPTGSRTRGGARSPRRNRDRARARRPLVRSRAIPSIVVGLDFAFSLRSGSSANARSQRVRPGRSFPRRRTLARRLSRPLGRGPLTPRRIPHARSSAAPANVRPRAASG